MESISSADARLQFSDLLAKAYYQNKTFIIERCSRPMAVLISIEEFEKIKPIPKKSKPKTKSSTKKGVNK